MGNEQGRVLSPEEIRAREISQMDSEVKKKLSQTRIKYNLKVVIKGDRNTGKTCLWRRLQGLSFPEEYIPTPEIQVAHINWSYKVSDDIVKVEVWDVVDKAKPKKKNGLKISTDTDADDDSDAVTLPPPTTQQGSFSVDFLDANTVDVLKGAHAVIVMLDPTKKWTWDYAQKELAKLPKDMYALVLANYRDLGEHRVVSEYEIKDFCKRQGQMVKYIEGSMANGYGLKSVVSFFNIPFLHMQRQYIQAQLDRNTEEIRTAEDELQVVTDDQSYDFYVKWLESSKKEKKITRFFAQPESPNQPRVPVASSTTKATDVQKKQEQLSPPLAQKQELPPPTKTAEGQKKQEPVSAPTSDVQKKQEPASPKANEAQKKQEPAPTAKTNEVQRKQDENRPQPSAPTKSLFSRISGMMGGIGSAPAKAPEKTSDRAAEAAAQSHESLVPPSIEEYSTGNLDDDFFGDGQSTVSPFAGVKESEHLSTTQNEEDDEEPNPLVAKDETIDDEFPSPIGSLDSKPAMKRTNSSTQQKSSVTKAPGKTTSSGDTPTDTPSTSNKLTESPVSHIKPAESSNRAAEAPAAKKAPVKQKSPEIAKPAKPSEPIPKHKPAVTHYDDEDDEEAVNPAIMQDEDFGDYEALPKKKVPPKRRPKKPEPELPEEEEEEEKAPVTSFVPEASNNDLDSFFDE